MEKIIVLGATGNIGQVVLKHLQNKAVEVFGGVRSETSSEQVSQWGATPIVVDFTDKTSLEQALNGKDRVFLVTPLMQRPELVTQMVAEVAKVAGLKHFVRSTAMGAAVNGPTQMARWAGASEVVLQDSGLAYTILQPASFLQNFINYHQYTIQQYQGFYLPVGDATTALVDVNDIGAAAALVLTSEDHYGKTYQLSGNLYTYADLASTLTAILGRKISYIDVPEEQAKSSMLEQQMPLWMVDAMMGLNHIIKQGWTAQYTTDYEELTGKPYTSAQEFFETNRQFFE